MQITLDLIGGKGDTLHALLDVLGIGARVSAQLVQRPRERHPQFTAQRGWYALDDELLQF